MAIGRGGHMDQAHDLFNDSGYLSDESEFFGDEATIQGLERRADDFDAAAWWANKKPTLTEMAIANISTAVQKKEATLHNPYEGYRYGRQLGETVDEFLQRLPPATTQGTGDIPWIFIANPYRKAPALSNSESFSDEGPAEEGRDRAQFVRIGSDLLEQLANVRCELEKQMEGKAKATITRAVNPEKDRVVRKILDAAINLRCTSGKWMLFIPPVDVNAVWAVVARATANNDLGIAAKVAPQDPSDPSKFRLVCIYTKDFTDMDDVTRVAQKMKDIGLIDTRERPIYYKCNLYTYLHLTSDNPYGIKASIYDSATVLDKSKNKKLVDSLFYKKKDMGDWRQLE